MTSAGPVFDGVILAGGRSSRLGGVPKAGLILEGQTLLQRTCASLKEARTLTVVGPKPETSAVTLATPVTFVREEPAFGGPAAALVAGFTAGSGATSPWCAVVACDMPKVGMLIAILLAAADADGHESLVALEDGREQPLAALYRTDDLARAIDSVSERGPVADLSMRSLLASVRTRHIPVPPGTTHDVDTWADALELGVDVP